MKTIITIITVLLGVALLFSSLFYYGCNRIANSYALSGGYKVLENKVIYDTGLHGLGTRENWEVKGADVESFKTINRHLAKDKHKVYMNGKEVFEGNSERFKLIRDIWWKNQNHVFKGSEIVSSDPDNFKTIKWDGALLYAKDKTTVYFNGESIPVAKAQSFKSIGKGYFVDASHAFHGATLIPGSHGPSFVVINNLYAKDKNKVWKKGDRIENANPKSFKPLKHPYSRDASHIFYNTRVLSWHPDQFKVLGKGVIWKYATDGKYIFHGGAIVDKADPLSFQVLANGYAKDKSYVFRGRSILTELDPTSFEVLNTKYAKDAHKVVYEERIISEANPESFQTHPEISNEAKDRNSYFKSGYPSKTDYGW